MYKGKDAMGDMSGSCEDLGQRDGVSDIRNEDERGGVREWKWMG